jgi:hypothetical protein
LGQKSSLLLAWGIALALGVAAGCGEKFSEGPGSGGAGTSSGGSDSTDAGAKPDGGKSSAGAAMSGGNGGRAGNGGLASTGGKGGTETTMGGSLPIAATTGDGGAAGASVDAPLPIPEDGLELWLDASRGVGQVNGIVSTWADQSGHHRDALQTANNLRPKLVDGALSGKPAIVFDGAADGGDYLKLPTLDADYTDGLSIFIVAQQKEPADVQQCVGFFEASNGSEMDDFHVGVWQNTPLLEVIEDIVHDTNYTALYDAPELIGAMVSPSKTAVMRRNSNGVGEGQVTLPENKPRSEVFIGHTLYQGCAPFQGAIGEIILYSRAVTDPELIQIESYLQKRWGCCNQ